MVEAETSGTILSRTTALIRGNALAAVIGIVGLSGADMIIDRLPTQSFALTGLVSLIAQYALIAAALRKLGLIGEGEGAAKLPAMFGLLFVTNLATLIGVVLLIVPGVILAVRWSIVVPILLAERTTIREAMRQSWERTAGRFWPIFGVFAIFTGALVVAVGVAAMFEGNVVATVATSVVINVVVVAMWYADIAIYEHGRPATSELEEVFA
jgi:hypothetical protein